MQNASKFMKILREKVKIYEEFLQTLTNSSIQGWRCSRKGARDAGVAELLFVIFPCVLCELSDSARGFKNISGVACPDKACPT